MKSTPFLIIKVDLIKEVVGRMMLAGVTVDQAQGRVVVSGFD